MNRLEFQQNDYIFFIKCIVRIHFTTATHIKYYTV